MKMKKHEKIFKTGKSPLLLTDYIKLCAPILLFPLLYLPYKLWWIRGFAMLTERMLHGDMANPMRILFTGNNTILLFWCVVTAAVMLLSLVISVIRIRPWYIIPLYLAVMFSMCGIFSMSFYTLIVR